jgi:hypothetical protein
MLAVLSLFLGACRSHTELLEAELRAKESQVADLRKLLQQREQTLEALEREFVRLHQQSCGTASGPSNAGLPALQEIRLGRLSGGYDEDPLLPGDEALLVLVEPRDADGQSVKVLGFLRLEVFEITPQGIKVPLSCWEFSPTELRRTWDTPVFGSPAYRIVVPWKSWPRSERLRVVARFTTLDGVHFEADRDVTVRPAADPPRSGMPTEGSAPCLPQPRPVPGSPAPDPAAHPPHLPPPAEPPLPGPFPELPPAASNRPGEIAPAGYSRWESPPPRLPCVGLQPPRKTGWKPLP